ncbi:MAG TPA: hypothetical protein VFI48_15495 [Hyphomicrobiaceae bacterium]|nr:hypothetical protein [Hyphomicrobiaceae bacterium]
MLSAEDSRVLTESGVGTLMGELLRRFWLPVLLSEELPEPDGPPKKIVVMGEPLLGFRDTRGRIGIIDQREGKGARRRPPCAPLPRTRGRLHHPEEQGPRRRDGGALWRQKRLRRRGIPGGGRLR